jgi:DNA-directed RNA polymerase specialized sigma24 family protein
MHPDAAMQGLVARIIAGDRVALGEFLGRYGPQIRRRVRGKLRASVRRIFDSQDIMSTVGRRLDDIVREGRVKARSEAEFWALVLRVAQNSVVEKARIVRALDVKEGEDSDFASWMLTRLAQSEKWAVDETADLAFDHMMSLLENDEDRTIATLWALGLSHPQIAEQVGLSHDAVRQRWIRIRDTLRARYKEFPT